MKYCISNDNLFISALTDDYFIGFNPFANKRVVIFNTDAKKLIDFLKMPKTYEQIKQNFNRWQEEQLRKALDNFLKFSILKIEGTKEDITFPKQSHLNVWFSVTNQCNLRCRYCFVPKANKKMSWPVAKKAVDSIFSTAKKNNLQKLVFKFGGGEPTLNFDLVKKIVNYVELVNRKYRKNVNFLLITNGVRLTEQMIKTIKKHKIPVSISMDGVGKWHDKQRIFPDGSGSFSFVKKTIKRLKEAGIKPRISSVVSNENCAGLSKLVKFVLDGDYLSYNKFGFYKENNLSFSDINLRLNREKTVKALKKAYKEIENYYRKRSRNKEVLKPRYLGALLDEIHFIYLRKHACGAGRSFLSVDWDGNVLPCAQFKDEIITTVENKDLLKASKEYFKNSKTGMKNLDVDEKEGCQDCQWRYWCGGGCPSVAYRAYGTYYKKSPYCEIYKEIIPEFLKLEGYRILSERKLL